MNDGMHPRFQFDFAVYGQNGRLSALLEAKRRFNTEKSWAREWHAIVFTQMSKPVDANILLIAPDRIYAWEAGADAAADPTWVLDARPLFSPYFERLKISPGKVDPLVFEEIVGLWLEDTTQGKLSTEPSGALAHQIFDELRGGEVRQQVAA